jgi:translocation and assembly module TamB
MKNSLKIIISLLLIASVSFFTMIYWLHTPHGQSYITQIITKKIAEKTNLTAQIDNIEISLTSGLKVQNIAIYKKQEHVADIKSVVLRPHLSIFMLWQISIPQIIIDEVHLIKAPKIKIRPSKKSKDFYNIYSFLPNIKIKDFKINKLILSPHVTNQEEEFVLSTQSNISFYPNKTLIKFKLSSNVISSPALFEGLTFESTGKFRFDVQKLEVNERITSKFISIDGKSSYDVAEHAIYNNFQYEINDLNTFNQFSTKLIGNTKGTASIDGPINNLSVNIAGNLSLSNSPTIEYNAALKAANDLNGTIALASENLSAAGKLSYISDKIKLQEFTISGKDLNSEIDLEYNLNTQLLSGSITHQDNSLSEVTKYFSEINSGKLYFKSVFGQNGDKQTFQLNAQITDLSAKFGLIDNIILDIYSPSLSDKKFSKFDILLQYFTIQDFLIKEISFNGKSTNKNLEFTSNIISHNACLMNINSKGNIDFTEGTKITIPSIEGKFGSSVVKLTKPINITFRQEPITFIDIFYINMDHLQIGNGTIKLYAEASNEKITSKLDLYNIPTDLCDKFLDTNFRNNIINGQASLEGSIWSPILNTNFEITQQLGSTPIKMSVNSKTSDQKTIIDIKLHKAQKNIGLGNIEVANHFSLFPLTFEFLYQKPFSASMTINEKLDIFELMPGLLEHKILGKIHGSLRAHGTLDKLIFDGNFKLTDGQYKHKKFNVRLENISLNINTAAEKLLFNNIIAHDNLGNKLHGQGFINFFTKNFEFKFNTKNLHAINNLYMNGALSGEVNYSGDEHKSAITGDFTFGPMEINIPDKFNQEVPELNVINEITELKNLQTDQYLINLDFKLRTTDKVFVSGRGVTSRLEGKLKVTGDVKQPLIDGSLQAVEGTFKEFGRVLNVEKSTLVFKGPLNPSPYLNIVGTTTVEDFELRVMLTGSITDPILDISSSPALTKEKALSVLLFGTDTPSPFQALQLANSARKLAGSGTSFDPLDFSKKMLFIDDLNFKADPNNPESYSIQAGKYLSDKIYLEIQHGGVEKLTKTKLEVQLTPRISIENINDYQEDNNIGIKWKMDY